MSLIGAEIPADQRHYYGKSTHFRRDITVEIPEVYDGGLFTQCPDCGGRWHRFAEGHPLRAVAEQQMRRVERARV